MNRNTKLALLLQAWPFATSAQEAEIPGVVGTGVDDNGELLAAETIDPHWKLVSSPDDDFPGPDVLTLKPGFPVGPWVAEGPDSKWVAPQSDQGKGNAPGVYVYRLEFDLSGFDPETAKLVGQWTADDTGPEIVSTARAPAENIHRLQRAGRRFRAPPALSLASTRSTSRPRTAERQPDRHPHHA